MLRLILLALPVLAIAAAFAMPSLGALWPFLQGKLIGLQSFAAAFPLAAAGLYVASYAGMTVLCLPAGPLMGFVGGILFGAWAGALLAAAGGTMGAALLFGFARLVLERRMGPRQATLVARIRPRLERDGFWAVLALRIPPVLPSWLLNLGAAVAGMRLLPFVAGTALGLIPASAVFAGAGAGLGDVLASSAAPNLDAIVRPRVLLPLLAMAGLVVLPVLVRTRP